MPVQSFCPSCGSRCHFPNQLRGQKVRCRICQAEFVIGATALSKPPPVAQKVETPATNLPTAHVVQQPTGPTFAAPDLAVPARRVPRVVFVAGGLGALAGIAGLVVVGIALAVKSAKKGSEQNEAKASEPRSPEQPAPGVQPPPEAPKAEKPPAPNAAMPQAPEAAAKHAKPATGPPPSANAKGELTDDVLKKVKNATVYIEVAFDRQFGASGSGFFAHSSHTVVTNAHVVGMLHQSKRRPLQIDVVVHSGEPNEKRYSATILAVDQEADLAALRIEGDNVPEPLSIASTDELKETQEVFIFGFPKGKALGKEVTVSSSAVSSLRRDETGLLNKVQFNGGSYFGNSGGPVVDYRGQVFGVVVSGVTGTQLDFAIPCDSVSALLQGRVTGNATFAYPFREGNATKVKVSLRLADPLEVIKGVGLDYWVGNQGQARKPTKSQPALLAGDRDQRSVNLSQGRDNATGEIDLPSLPPQKAYWFQPFWVDGSGQKRWAKATTESLPPTVERKPALLVLRYRAKDEHAVKLSCVDSFFWFGKGVDERHRLWTIFKINLGESINDAEDGGGASVRLVGGKVEELTFSFDGRQDFDKPNLKAALDFIDRVEALGRLDRFGNWQPGSPDVSGLDSRFQEHLSEMFSYAQICLGAVSAPLRGKQAEFDDIWTAQRSVRVLVAPSQFKDFTVVMTCRYVGVLAANPSVALIDIQGEVRASPSTDPDVDRRVTGSAEFDLEKGEISSASLLANLDLNPVLAKVPACANGWLQIMLQRTRAGR